MSQWRLLWPQIRSERAGGAPVPASAHESFTSGRAGGRALFCYLCFGQALLAAAVGYAYHP